MLTAKSVRAMSDDALAYTARDLADVIEVQESGRRAPDAGRFGEKLGQYYDELAVVRAEQKRRAAAEPGDRRWTPDLESQLDETEARWLEQLRGGLDRLSRLDAEHLLVTIAKLRTDIGHMRRAWPKARCTRCNLPEPRTANPEQGECRCGLHFPA